MALLDSIVKDVAQTLGLGDKADVLIGELLTLISSQQSGGLKGFLAKFEQAGLSGLVSSWVSSGSNAALSSGQVSQALGSNLLNNWAAKLGLSASTVSAALAALIPSVVDKLTPNGTVPDTVPSLSSLVHGLGDTLASVVSFPASASQPRGSIGLSAERLLPLVILLLLVALGYRYCYRAAQPAVTPTTPAASAAKINATLSLINVDGKVKATGVVPDERTRLEIIERLTAAFGEGNFAADLKIDPNAKAASWLEKLAELLKEFKIPGAELFFDGDAIKLGGAAAAGSLLDKLKALFGGFNISTNFLDIDAAVKAANEKAQAAIEALQPNANAEALVNALNLSVINFASGKADIPADNQALLKKSATAISAAPAGIKLEVGGHTDNRGNATGNQKLSQARADAVRQFLLKQGVKPESLVAKGYGDVKPVATNDTEEGRFKNRRIEFSVVK